MTNEALIRELVSDAQPVHRLAPPGRRCQRWLLLTLALLSAALAFGARADLVERCREGAFVLDGLGLLLLALLSARSAFQLSVPALHSPATFGLPLAGAALWLVSLAARALGAGALDAGVGLGCALRIAALGTLSLLVGWCLQRRATRLAAGWAGLFLGLAAFAFAALACRASCARDGVSHLLFWHCLPVLALSGLAALAAWSRWGSTVSIGRSEFSR
ncbi:MAG TPA: NrsF family protein [Polyangiaceae bacterium]|nr:NrsF family protein [Polyangiaceae bacterium]